MVSFDRSRIFRVGIVVIAAILVEVISIMQYERIRKMILEEEDIRNNVVMGAMAHEVEHLLDLTEATMYENLWEVQRCLAHPDSMFSAVVHVVDDNPYVVGGSLAFVPDYYPAKGRLFEPYASKKADGSIVVSQLAGPEHDYTQSSFFKKVLETEEEFWSNPYRFGPDSLSLVTFSYPIINQAGRLAAVCGLDIDLSWLGDTLNARQPYPSSFGLLLTREGTLVAGPPETRTNYAEVKTVLASVNGELPERAIRGFFINRTQLSREPSWQLVQVNRTDEVFARIRRQRRQQMLFILLGLAILAFMINLYARNEKKLQRASEEQARMGGELAVARRIQQEMLPKTFPAFVNGSLKPAREVGGDLFDYFIRDGKLFFCIGDVSGKGVPSAMLMSVAHSLFRMVSQKEESPSRILTLLNRELCRGNDSNMFMTFFVGCLDLYSGVLSFGNAGHDKPYVLTDQITRLPSKANLPLGVFPNTHFEEQTCKLAHGTTLLLYTDGLTEAKNAAKQPFGRTGVQAVLKDFLSGQDQSLGRLVHTLSSATHSFAAGAPQSDDLTMLAVRFAPEKLVRDQITLKNQLSEVNRLSTFIKDYFARFPIEGRLAAGMRLALEETVVNVIDYAYPGGAEGSLSVFADSNGEEIRFTVMDNGIPFDPTAYLEPDTTLDARNRPIGGLGILLSRKLMDSISYSRRNGQNVLYLTKSII